MLKNVDKEEKYFVLTVFAVYVKTVHMPGIH